MVVRFHARGDGAVAIYTGSDSDPMDAPLDHLSRVVFHSALRYPAIVDERSGTLSLPGRGTNTSGNAAHTLFAHGRAGTPLVIGYATIGGVRVRLAGSVPIQGDIYGWARWLSLGADATNVKMAEAWFIRIGVGGASIPWVAYVLDTNF